MKKVLLCATAVLMLAGSAARAGSGNLYEYAKDKRAINIKVDKFDIAGGVSEIDSGALVKSFNGILSGRKSVKFTVVDNENSADLAVRGRVKEFFYSETDPVDILLPIGLVVDLIKTQSYARMKFDIEVYDTEKNKVVWKEKLRATLNETGMTRDESIPLIMERAAKVFLKECFRRPR